MNMLVYFSILLNLSVNADQSTFIDDYYNGLQDYDMDSGAGVPGFHWIAHMDRLMTVMQRRGHYNHVRSCQIVNYNFSQFRKFFNSPFNRLITLTVK